MSKAPSGVNPTGLSGRSEESPQSERACRDEEHRPTEVELDLEGKTRYSFKDHGDLSIEEELFEAAESLIISLNKTGVSLGRTDINEPERQHIPNLVNMEEYEDWVKEAKPYAIDRNFNSGKKEFVGENIDILEILKDVTTQDSRLKKCRHAMVLGSTGTGKTTLLKRIALQSKHGLLEGKLPITVDLRRYQTEETLTPSRALLGNLFSDWDSERMKQRYQWIKENSEKVAFICDSLDTLPFELENERPRIGYNTPATVDVILHNLLAGDLFPKSVIISSSREYKVRNLHPSVRPDRCILLDGLKKESVEDLIDGFMGKDKGEEVRKHIDLECPDIWPLLSIPVFVVFTSISFQQDGFRPETMSGILIKFFLVLINSPHVHVKNILKVLKCLMPMSFEGVCKDCVLFRRDDLERFDLTPEQATDLGVLIPQPQGTFFSSKLMQNDRFFLYFNHQTEQECLAALHALSMSGENFTAFVKSDLYETKFTVVRRIICGILLNREVLEAATKLTEISAVDKKQNILLKSLENVIKERSGDQNMLLELFIDLNEAKQGVAELCRSQIRRIYFVGMLLSPSNVQAIASVMKQCEHLESVNLRSAHLNGEKMEILARTILQSILKIKSFDVFANEAIGPKGMLILGKLVKNHEVNELKAESCNLSSECLQNLMEGLGETTLEYLNVGGNRTLGPKGMFVLGKLVKNHEVNRLEAGSCNLNSECLQNLMNGLEEATLEHLDVTGNKTLGPEGMLLLGKLVKNHEVKHLQAGSRSNNSESLQKLTDGLEDAKVHDLDLDDVGEKMHYTSSLLVLLPKVENKLRLTGWRINKGQQQELQDKLNEIRSPSLRIKIGQFGEPMYLKADFSVEAGESHVMNKSDEVKQRIKANLSRPFCAAEVIGTNGGGVEVRGFELAFQQNAFDEDATVALTVRSEKDDKDADEGKAISPTVECSTGNVKFRGLATLKLPIHYIMDGSYITVLCKKNFQSQWKEIEVRPFLHENSVTCQVPHFCKFKAVWRRFTNLFWPRVLLYNFIYFNKDTSSVCVLTCVRQHAVQEACIRSLKEDGYVRAKSVPDSIKLGNDEEMSYSVNCEHPLSTKINPAEKICYKGAMFSDSDAESIIFDLTPAPETDIVKVHYMLNRPEENPKASVLSMKWKSSHQEQSSPQEEATPQENIPAIADATVYPTKVEVIGSTEIAYNAHSLDESIYCIDPRRRKGRALIINNDFHGTNHFREGSEVDVRNMRVLWRALGFDVVTKLNLSAQQMRDSCRTFAAESFDISVVVFIIMSHGEVDHDGKECFVGQDEEILEFEDVIATFTSNLSPQLRGIPKLFLFQACRGRDVGFLRDGVDARGVRERNSPLRTDMLITYATQSGYVAFRNARDGSWLMNAVTNVFMQHAHDTHVLDMLTMVNKAVSRRISGDREIQVSNQENYLKKKLFLYPGWPRR